MRKVLWVVVVCSFFLGFAVSNTYAAGQADAKALIEKGVAFYKANGPEKAFAEFSNPKGQFTKGDLYIFVIDAKGKVFAHGGNAKLVGQDVSELKDADGKFFMKEIIKTANEKGKGWVDYKWMNPVTKKVVDKTTYVEKIDGYVFGCGVYKD